MNIKLIIEAAHAKHFDSVLPDNFKALHLPCSIVTKLDPTSENISALHESFDEALKTHDAILICSPELLKSGLLHNTHKILDGYHNLEKIVYVHADSDMKSMKHYYEFCNQHSYKPLKMFAFNLNQFSGPMGKMPNDFVGFKNLNRSKVFNCLAYSARAHKDKIIAELHVSNLDHLGYISYGFPRLERRLELHNNPNNAFLNDWVHDFFKDNKSKFPMILDSGVNEFSNRLNWNKEILDYVNDSYVTVCVESFYLNYKRILEEGIPYKNRLDRIQGSEGLLPEVKCLTEKSYRPFLTGTLGLHYTTSGVLDRLRENYDIFDDIIDHSYDLVEDDEQRHEVFMIELKRLCNLSMSEWQDIYERTLARRIQNNKTYASCKNISCKGVFYTQPLEVLYEFLSLK